MTDIEFILSAHNINYSSISADEVKFIKEKLIPHYERCSNPIFGEYIYMNNEKLNECRKFKTNDVLNILKSVVDSFAA